MKYKKLISGMMIASAALLCVFSRTDEHTLAAKKETIDIRFVNTTDIHGQLTSMDYSKGTDAKNCGVARAFRLMLNLKSELPSANVFTFDIGDVLYDYTTEYIYAEDQYEIQPIYKALASMGYDAITLGNHDFDYGYDYMLRQLDETGLRDITVVSNVTDSKTGEFPFEENMLITRKMETNSGKQVEVTVGIIGETIPNLSSKTHSYTGILKTEDMVANTRAQAKKLKEQGADIIVVLAHTGMGPENPEENFKNVAYAITKIDEVDVVVCGHEHNEYPTSDTTSPYFNLPGVDKKTFLVNGKNVVMAADRGEAVGVVDLTLTVSGEDVTIADRSTRLEYVTKNVEEDDGLASLYGEWKDEFLTYTSEVIGTIDEDDSIDNFFGLIGDSQAIQLLNDAKRSYAINYIHTNATDYIGTPVIAASTYASYGVNSYQDYINLTNKITESDLASIQPYNNYLYLYEITGKQLKEWLEWSASAYETIGSTYDWSDDFLRTTSEKAGARPLLSEEWINDWSSFYIFDGISYEIDPSVGPRYNTSGTKIADTKRISKVTYNGVAVKDSDIFVIATNKLTKPTEANSGVETQIVGKGYNRSQSVLSDYIRQLTASDKAICPTIDYNWTIKLPAKYEFLVKIPSYAAEQFEESNYFVELVSKTKEYYYYKAKITQKSSDTSAPSILLAPMKTGLTNSKYDVAVNVTDDSEIKYIRYKVGNVDVDYAGWFSARELKSNNTFLVHENGVYTVYAEDIYGNKAVKTINITNFSDDVLATPVVATYTNRKTKISGTAEPNTTIYFEATGKTYKSTVDVTGKFSYSLPAQPSGTTIGVYTKDTATGKMSEEVKVLVKRTGPNAPTVNKIYNNNSIVTGNLNDDDASIMFFYDDTVLVAEEGGRELYINCELYDPSTTIIEIPVSVSASHEFAAMIPVINADTTVTIYTIDHVNRISRKVTTTVLKMGPNAPVIYEVSNIERVITGYVPEAGNKAHNIILEIGTKKYELKTDRSGNFTIEVPHQLYAGEKMKVTAELMVDGVKTTSYTQIFEVQNIENYVRKNSNILTLNSITTKSNYIVGTYTDSANLYLAICKGKGSKFESTIYKVNVTNSEKIRFLLDERLEEGMTVYAIARYSDKILQAAKVEVNPGRPDEPTLVEPINNSYKIVRVLAYSNSTVTLTVGKKVYTQTEFQYDDKLGGYVYEFSIDRANSGVNVTIVAENITGMSDVHKTTVKKVAPDQPTVKKVQEGATKIKGSIELLDGETTIYAKIGKKTYEGTVKEDGSFSIKVPELEEGTQIRVWGANEGNRGPLKIVTV